MLHLQDKDIVQDLEANVLKKGKKYPKSGNLVRELGVEEGCFVKLEAEEWKLML